MVFDRVRGNAEVRGGPSTRDLLDRAAELIPLARIHRVDRYAPGVVRRPDEADQYGRQQPQEAAESSGDEAGPRQGDADDSGVEANETAGNRRLSPHTMMLTTRSSTPNA